MRTQAVLVLMAHSLIMITEAIEFGLDRSYLPGPVYPLHTIPLFDEKINGLFYLRNRLVLKFQMRCILTGGPCDVVGRWLKPRVEKIFFEGKCELCTPTQMPLVKLWTDKFVEAYPDLFRAGVAKYLENMGIEIPEDERRKMIAVLGDDY